MSRREFDSDLNVSLLRRRLLGGAGAALGGALAFPRWANAQAAPGGPVDRRAPSPSRRATSVPQGAPTTYFTDPDVLTIDPMFDGLRQPNAPIQRLWTGALWSEGPAWNSVGRFLVWSDIPNNRQLRWSEDDGHVSVFRSPSNNSNGNTFDFQGRQLSCEHLTRRVVRYELDGSATILASTFNGKRLNSPNDVVPHPDGSYWFTDPPYGAQLYEGTVDAAGGPANKSGRMNPRLGQPPEIGTYKRELPTAVYRLDTSGTLTQVAGEDLVPDPNGLCFSPDLKKLYVVSTGQGPGDSIAGGKGDMRCSTSVGQQAQQWQAVQQLHARARAGPAGGGPGGGFPRGLIGCGRCPAQVLFRLGTTDPFVRHTHGANPLISLSFPSWHLASSPHLCPPASLFPQGADSIDERARARTVAK